MGSLINLVKKLFSGIFSFIGGLVGGKKGGYYLELSDADAGKPAPAKVEATPEKAAPARAKVEKPAPQPVAVDPASLNGAKPAAPATSNGAAMKPAAASAAAATILSTPRRRPGANMSSFLEMAKQVKTPG